MTENWKIALDKIDSAVNGYKQYAPIMTQMERMVAQQHISGLLEQHKQTVVNHTLTEWEQALQNVKGAFLTVKEAKKAEVREWDAGKLNAEMQSIETRIRHTIAAQPETDAVQQLNGMYTELAECGDPYKQRAAAEAFRSLNTQLNTSDGRVRANRIVQQAQRDLDNATGSGQLAEAHKAAAAAVEGLNAAKQLVAEVDQKMGTQHPNGNIGQFDLWKAVGRVGTDDEGNITQIDGEKF